MAQVKVDMVVAKTRLEEATVPSLSPTLSHQNYPCLIPSHPLFVSFPSAFQSNGRDSPPVISNEISNKRERNQKSEAK